MKAELDEETLNILGGDKVFQLDCIEYWNKDG